MCHLKNYEVPIANSNYNFLKVPFWEPSPHLRTSHMKGTNTATVHAYLFRVK